MNQLISPVRINFLNNLNPTYLYLNLKVGDIITRIKDQFYDHYGIVIGYNYNGDLIVAENQRGKGVQFITLEEFLNGKILKVVERFPGTEQQRNEVLPRVKALQGKSYNLLFFNCEHFATGAQTGVSTSVQVLKTLGIGAGIIGTGYLLYKGYQELNKPKRTYKKRKPARCRKK